MYEFIVFRHLDQKQAEHGFGEHGFTHPTQRVFWPSPSSGGKLSEFLSAYYLCANATSPSCWQNSPSLLQNSVSSFFRNSTLEAVFCPLSTGNRGQEVTRNGGP